MAESNAQKPAHISNPDPTERTKQEILREISLVRELIDSRIDGLKELFNEKMARVAADFEQLERRRVEQKEDTKATVDAALTAQKEAVREQTLASDKAISKSEEAMTKQIDLLNTRIQTEIIGLRRDIDENRKRISTVE